MTSSQNNLPQRMYRNSRPKDPYFEPNEKLYRRFQNGEAIPIQIEGSIKKRLLPESIDLPSCSTNRSKYSQPRDVLLPSCLDWGIARFQVKDVPLELKDKSNKICCAFRVEHFPEEENYAHSEVRSYNNKKFDKPRRPGNILKKQIRQIISDKADIIHDPQQGPMTEIGIIL